MSHSLALVNHHFFGHQCLQDSCSKPPVSKPILVRALFHGTTLEGAEKCVVVPKGRVNFRAVQISGLVGFVSLISLDMVML